jgi:hypothetical protein
MVIINRSNIQTYEYKAAKIVIFSFKQIIYSIFAIAT